MSFKLTILGCNSAIPSISRFTTAQALQRQNKIYIIDAGEGVQIRINQNKIKKSKIHEIFISHLHGDHFFGLPGLLTSLNLSGRTQALSIYGPKGIQAFIDTLIEIGSLYLNFELKIVELVSDVYSRIFEDDEVEVYSIPLKHRIPTNGFLFREKPTSLRLKAENIKKFSLSIDEIKQLKAGKDVLRNDGSKLAFTDHTHKASPPTSYAFCSDTIYDEDLLPFIKGVDVLYHEATYLDDLREKARERGHASSKEAAKIAKLAGAKKLILGHYSSRYKDISVFKEEAKTIFENIELADDGVEFHF